MNTTPSFPPMRLWEWVVLVLCVGLFLGQMALASPQKSAVVDEQYHLAAGYAFLKTGEFPLLTGHPPLMNALAALPLLWRDDVYLPLDHPSWAEGNYFIFGDVFMWQANPTSTDFLLWARWPIMAVGAVLVVAIFAWARQLGGVWAGWLALGLATFDPNLLTHSRLVTTDLGLTCFVFLTIWQLWRLLEKERHNPEQANWANLAVVGLLAGLTMATKFTGILIWPIIGIILWLTPIHHSPFTIHHSPFFSKRLQQLLIMGLCAYAAIWAVYGFDFGPIPGSRFPLPVPAPLYPRDAWNLFMVIEQEPVPAFLLGRTSPRGWWFYFPVALLVKTPLPLLFLAVVGLVALRWQVGWRKTAVFLIAPTLFMLLAMTGRFTIGYRHILAVVPFLVLFASQSSRLINGRFALNQTPYPIVTFLIVGLLGWQVVGTARLWPHQEAFFNELASGPVGGGRVLADSNIDWGQDLPALRRLMDDMGIEQVYLGYYGTAVPERYGVRYRPIPGFLRFTGGPEIEAFNPYTPMPGWYAISLTSLRLGLFYQNRHLYRYFWRQEPVARAGYSINLYYVQYPPDMPVDRRVVVGRSVSDIPPRELQVHPGRRLIVKWVQSPETAVLLAGSPEQTQVLARLQTDCSHCSTADFAGAFTLLGAIMADDTVQPGQAVDLQLYWQVETAEIPTPFPAFAAPLAAFVHLTGAEPGQILSQYDGWGAALTGLEPGDLIVQRVVLPVPADTLTGQYTVQLGLYSPQTGQRLVIVGETADFVTLETAVKITE